MLRGAVKVTVLAVVVYHVVKTALFFGIHLHYQRHYPGNCRHVKGLDFASEDFEITKNGLAFISSGVSFPFAPQAFTDFMKSNNVLGRIYLYDFKKPDLGARKLPIKPSKDFNPHTFHPHGISLLEDETKGEHLLYVINHPNNADDVIEKFRYLPKSSELVHLKSFSSDKLQLTNDLAVAGEDQLYISNYLYFKNRFMSLIEQAVLPFGLGSVLFFNGTDFAPVDTGLHSPNGVSLSKDKRHLYVTITPTQTLNVYEVKGDHSLVLTQSVVLHTRPDNLHLDQAGNTLYLGAHPIYHKLMSHLLNPNNSAPSSILSLPLKDGKVVSENITELFYDHGDLISGSSVAAVYNKKLLIGSIINKLVICDANF